ncbi:NAD(P)H-dependent oxidoreductase [uncultured Sphaerochaeta sp.]|uniref:flavodoxin family protein n=1 Tax=uncultured Sphaerochaeta sp. TaxID=886478 RepID=UPI002A0A51EC|nr:NAD(P)H-dependent oxidoreductase [uncultured Sphaerochaeta sp.]
MKIFWLCQWASLSTLLKSDMVILGSPTRFGNISAEMKTFLDTTLPLSKDRSLETKFFACFHQLLPFDL